ncbi:MAG TPA: hypothetical protein VI389_08795 [Geobacteraceae bacterium]
MTAVRSSTVYLGGTGVLLLALSLLLGHARYGAAAAAPLIERKARLVRDLELTDLCLFTEASYTRHLSMTDFTTPFLDSPFAFEHFPTGALAGPPPHLVRTNVTGN